jgi:hypothetical protein
MSERILKIVSLISSLGIIAGLVLVLLQLKQAEQALTNDTLNSTDAMVGSALLGEDFYNTYYRVKADAPDLTNEDKVRYGEFLEFVANRIFTDSDYYEENPKNVMWILCSNFNNAVGIEWLEFTAQSTEFIHPGRGSLSTRNLEIIKSGKCEGIISWSQHLSATQTPEAGFVD